VPLSIFDDNPFNQLTIMLVIMICSEGNPVGFQMDKFQ